MKILMVLTSHDRLGSTGKATGFWLEEFATPYYVFKDANAEITLASPRGGQPPIDPKSDETDAQTTATRRFRADAGAQALLAKTKPLSSLHAEDFDAIFYPGGHGPLWDLAEDRESLRIVETMYELGKPVGAVCHGPGVFRHANGPYGLPLVCRRAVTGFSNSEEAAVGLSDVVPFLVEDMLREKGGLYEKGPDWEPHVVIDGILVTGQNPASSEDTARALLSLVADDHPFLQLTELEGPVRRLRKPSLSTSGG